MKSLSFIGAASGSIGWLLLIGQASNAAGPDSPPPSDSRPHSTATSSTPAAELDRDFRASIQPFLQTYCVSCHGEMKPQADLVLSRYTTLNSVTGDLRRWELILERLRAGDMPPEDASKHPSPESIRGVITWAEMVRRSEAERNAGDPGPVPARRLSNAEYNHTIRDLTGVDLRPTRDFPVDPANEAGFDNSGESLATSPALVTKYLEAARQVAEHLVLTLDGLEFAPHVAVTETDRDKFCVNRIVAFYRQQRTDVADYFLAAWNYKHRAAWGREPDSLVSFAREAGLSPKYLATIWELLETHRDQVGPIAALHALWSELPDGVPADENAARTGCEQMRDFVTDLRAKLVPTVDNLTAPKIHNGSQPLVLWKNRQFAANRRRYTGGALTIQDLRLPGDSPAAQTMTIPSDPDAIAHYESTFHRFCDLFPDAFYVSERARVYLDPEQEKKLAGRLLSAGFHSQMGYFRDDGPLYDLMLDDSQRRELDRLWRELDFATSAPVRQYKGLIWFDRTDSAFMRDPEFDPFRAEDKDCTSADKVRRLSEVYLTKAERCGAGTTALTAIRDYFRDMNTTFRWLEETHRAAEPRHLAALLRFAERAYRRTLAAGERESLSRFYRSLRDDEGLSHEDAIRDTLVSVLMSPHFCFRVDLPGPGKGPVVPLTDVALASRLSYFLWASLPDQELFDHASAGRLHDPAVLRAQTGRMLRDSRVRGLATEFAANWLDFRRFEEHNAVDRGRFPAFDDELREAMFEEPIRFFTDLVSRDGSMLEFLYADHTFVNAPLARHYGMPIPESGWSRVEGAREHGRGGLLPMAVFLTKNAPGLRTSPVKRGYWVARRLLGEHIPAPPPNVPELPADEAQLGELTLREALIRHRSDKNCAACHERFDSLGLVFEAYGPIGERRTLDLGGRPVDTRATFPDAEEGDGINGLATYIRQRRQGDFVDNVCRKLLAYALGRNLLASDDLLVNTMRTRFETDAYRFSGLVETIVTSPQFLHQRSPDAAPQ